MNYYILLAGAISILMASSCKKADPVCVEFTSDESQWNSYRMGDSIKFISDDQTDSLQFLVVKQDETEHKNRRYNPIGRSREESCEKKISTELTTILSNQNHLRADFVLYKRNASVKGDGKVDGFKFKLIVSNFDQFTEVADKDILPETKTIRGKIYQNVLSLYINKGQAPSSTNPYETFDTLYYAKSYGAVAIHLSFKNQWYYIKN